MLSLRLQTTMHRTKSCSMLSQYTWDNIAQTKTLCNVVREAPDNCAREKSCEMLSKNSWDNITSVKTLCNVVTEVPHNNAQEKILFNNVLVLSGQHCTGQNSMQCCSKDCCFNTHGTTLHS